MYVIVVGGGAVGFHLTRLLQESGHEVALVERDPARAREMISVLGEAVIVGDGTSAATLKEAGATRADALAAVTGDDDENLIICQLAKVMFFTTRTIARVNDPGHEAIFQTLGVDATVSATRMMNTLIQEQMQAPDTVVPLLTLKGGQVELVQVEIAEESPAANKRVRDLALPEGCILISITRGDDLVLPRGDTMIRPDDQVVALIRTDQAPLLPSVL